MPSPIRKMLLAGLLLMLSDPTMVSAQSIKLPPVSNSGLLGYSYGLTQAGATDVQTHTALFNWNFSSYIKQPYIAQYYGAMNLSYNTTTSAGKKSTQKSVLGNLIFRLFPTSSFPFEVFVNRSNNLLDNSLGDLITERTAYGLSQRYTSRNKTSYFFRFEDSQQTFDDRVAVRNQQGKSRVANLNIEKSMRKWSLQWENEYLRRESSTTSLVSKRIHSILRHSWRPGNNLRMNGFTLYRDIETLRANTLAHGNKRVEFNNYIYWRPDTRRRMVFNSALRHVENLGDNRITGNRGGRTTTLSGGFSYQVNDRFGLSASAFGSADKSETENTFSSFASLEGRYASRSYNWNSYLYQWNATLGGELNDQLDEFGSVITGTSQLGHSISRRFFANRSPLLLRLSQNLAVMEGTDQRSTRQLNHQLSLNWNRVSHKHSSSINFSLSDFRSQGGGGRTGNEDREIQFATLVFSQAMVISQFARLTGSASVQLRNQSTGKSAFSQDVLNGSADLTYFNSGLFNLPSLQFRSTLRWYSTSFISAADDPGKLEGTEGLFWENRMDYRLGRLTFRLIARLTSINDINRNFINFQVRRHFNGMLFD